MQHGPGFPGRFALGCKASFAALQYDARGRGVSQKPLLVAQYCCVLDTVVRGVSQGWSGTRNRGPHPRAGSAAGCQGRARGQGRGVVRCSMAGKTKPDR